MASDPTTPPEGIAVTQEGDKVRIMQQILATATGTLSIPEISVRNNMEEEEVRDLLTELKQHNPALITRLHPDVTPPKQYPSVYVAITEHGINALKEAGLYDQIGLLYGAYDAADIELPDNLDVTIGELENWEHRPTPDWI